MEEHAQNDVKNELAVEYSKLHIMSVSNTIGILFISWKMVISLISLCLTQYLYPAMVVKNVFPIHATRVTDIVDWLYCMKISEKNSCVVSLKSANFGRAVWVGWQCLATESNDYLCDLVSGITKGHVVFLYYTIATSSFKVHSLDQILKKTYCLAINLLTLWF